MTSSTLFPAIAATLSQLDSAGELPADRLRVLDDLARWIAAQHARGETAPIIFICTHNSRRSHMAQLWMQAAAHGAGLTHVQTYSGGTEATAFHPNAVEAMRGCGFRITVTRDGANPLYGVRYAEDTEAMPVWSKTFGDAANPHDTFAAVMTCSDADEACPVVPGAAARFSLPYRDPKESDNTTDVQTVYASRSREIAREMQYVIRRAAEMTKTGDKYADP